MAAQKNASHAEIWDDSMLVDSWNDALEEYKQYHSIQARGENVEDILIAAEEKDAISNGDLKDGSNKAGENFAQSSFINDATVKDGKVDQTGPQVETKKSSPTTEGADTTPSSGPAVPQHLIGQVHDESLKNLLMSWYYAGYYTGLYEGQQGAASSKTA